MIEPIIMLTDHPLLAPHRQVRRCHRSGRDRIPQFKRLPHDTFSKYPGYPSETAIRRLVARLPAEQHGLPALLHNPDDVVENH